MIEPSVKRKAVDATAGSGRYATAAGSLLAMMANSDPKQATSRNRVIMSISFVVYPRYGAIMLAGC
jgi:hypothetical protein